ncbi:MAG: hypothetical protein FGM40_01930 [Rhodocyclaceae bacterium]|nr:hypothetical protein [Rhodocyclaceae bacterium]
MSLAQAAALAGLVFLALEVLLPALIFLGFAGGAFAVAGLAWFGGFETGTYVIVFAVVSAVLWLLLRLAFRHRGDVRAAEGDVNRY